MSRGQQARTPANFPRMKHRAAGRIARRRQGISAWHALIRISISADQMVEALKKMSFAAGGLLKTLPRTDSLETNRLETLHRLATTPHYDQGDN